jgi:leucyl aminopeptidase
MELEIEARSPVEVKTELLVIGAFADGTLSPTAAAVDKGSQGKIANVLKKHDLEDKPGSSVLLYEIPGTKAERLLVISLGKKDKWDEKAYRAALKGAGRILSRSAAKTALVTLPEVEVKGHDETWRIQEAALQIADAGYRFAAPKERAKDQAFEPGVAKVSLFVSKKDEKLKTALERGRAIADGMALTKDLGNLPGNVCHPTYLAETAKALGKELEFDVEVLERSDMEKLGMHSALSVGRASEQPCKFIVMNYKGGGKAKPVVLVGKGVTFDTGGVSLKPGADMDEMKYDMCGAATVFGAMRTIASLKLPINLVGIVPAVENMPGGNATRPGDVVKSMSGLTIEILNTDAEGRLILCDALTYAERFNPEYVVDIATLTGACVIALGGVASGLYANDEKLGSELFKCGMETGDRAWPMPLWDDYLDQLKSNFADLSNLGGRPAGSVTAACFLGRFTDKYKWAHLDIAGTASVSGADKGATGRPVPLLSEFLFRQAEGKAHARA